MSRPVHLAFLLADLWAIYDSDERHFQSLTDDEREALITHLM